MPATDSKRSMLMGRSLAGSARMALILRMTSRSFTLHRSMNFLRGLSHPFLYGIGRAALVMARNTQRISESMHRTISDMMEVHQKNSRIGYGLQIDRGARLNQIGAVSSMDYELIPFIIRDRDLHFCFTPMRDR